MSYTYLSADWHLSHENIIKYSNRPFQDCIHMNETLIKNANERMNEDDIFIHVGDWCFTNKNIKQKASDYEKRIKAKLIHVNGNHDKNNSVKSCIEEITLKTANWKYKPVRLNEVVEYYKKIQREIVEEKLKLKSKR